MNRFRDNLNPADFFKTEFLVVCARCHGCARVFMRGDGQAGPFAERSLSCVHCGYSKKWQKKVIHRQGMEAVDDYFQLPLWLQTGCGRNKIYAFNEAHLAYMEAFFSANLRERRPHRCYGRGNRSFISRLPHWMKSANNRQPVMKGLARLREKLSKV